MNILSIDGGATSLKAGILSLESQSCIEEYKINKAFNFTSLKSREGINTLKELLESIGQKNIDKIVVGMSGADSEEELNTTKKIVQAVVNNSGYKSEIIVVNDIELVLNNTDSEIKNRIAVISGTGSNCLGINEIGEKAKAGGLDYILTDQGGGYDIGLMALKSAVEVADGRIKHSNIKEAVFKELKVSTLEELKSLVHSDSFEKRDFAKLTLAVVEQASKKDKLCSQILEQAGYELFKHVKAVANQLQIIDKELLVIEAGSMFKILAISKSFEELTREYLSNVSFEYPSNPSYYGALKLI